VKEKLAELENRGAIEELYSFADIAIHRARNHLENLRTAREKETRYPFYTTVIAEVTKELDTLSATVTRIRELEQR
jgi:hypothetical protein